MVYCRRSTSKLSLLSKTINENRHDKTTNHIIGEDGHGISCRCSETKEKKKVLLLQKALLTVIIRYLKHFFFTSVVFLFSYK